MGLQRTGTLDVHAARLEAERAGFFVFELPAIVDQASFFDAVRATFPLDPPVMGSHGWDALADSLWEGLYTHPARRIAILWPSTRAMETAASAEFEIALEVLAHVAQSLADPRFTCGAPKEVAILVA